MSVLLTLGLLALVAFWGLGAYKRLVRLRRQVTSVWQQIDVQLKQRHDLVPGLVDTVTGVMAAEPETLGAVRHARDRAVAATSIAEAGRREDELTEALGRFFASAGADPRLAADAGVQRLQEQLTGTGNTIASGRRIYNDIAAKYNTATEVMPGNIVAGIAGFRPAESFETADPAQ